MGSAASFLSKNKDEKTGAFSGLMVIVVVLGSWRSGKTIDLIRKIYWLFLCPTSVRTT
jgi:cobalamin synthase